MKRRFVFCLFMLHSFFSSVAIADPMTFVAQSNGGNCAGGCVWIYADGEITNNTRDEFLQFRGKHFEPDLIMNSQGGDLASGFELGRLIRQEGLSTQVGKTAKLYDPYSDVVDGGVCSGACAYAFLGGLGRNVLEASTMSEDADGTLRFDPFSSDEILENIANQVFSGADRLADQAAAGLLINYLVEMGVSPRLYSHLSALSPGSYLEIDRDLAIDFNIIPEGFEVPFSWKLKAYDNGLVAELRHKMSAADEASNVFYCSEQTGEFYAVLRFSDAFQLQEPFIIVENKPHSWSKSNIQRVLNKQGDR